MDGNKFFVIRTDGSLAAAQRTLGGAMDFMGNGRMLFMGTPTEAVRVMTALGRQRRQGPEDGVGTLLQIGLDAEEGK
jgi:hypothetical protein